MNSKLLAACLAFASAAQLACDPATNGDYPGEPIASVQGLITAAENDAPQANQLRLAAVWFPQMIAAEEIETKFKSVVSQDLPYEGVFPISYTFEFYSAPAEALVEMELEGAKFRVASGFLVAYHDKNGNKKLDTIPAGGTPIDRVIGTSAPGLVSSDGLGASTSDTYMLMYIEGELPQYFRNYGIEAPGFYVGRGNSILFGQDVDVPIVVSNSPKHDLAACEEHWGPWEDRPRKPCGIWPGVDGLSPPLVQLSAVFTSTGREDSVTLDVHVEGLKIRDAIVTVNGTTVPLQPETHNFTYDFRDSTGGTLVLGGLNTVRVTKAGFPDLVIPVQAPNFEITAPAHNAQVAAGTPLTLTLANATKVSEFQVFTYGGSSFSSTGSTAVSYTLPGASASYSLQVSGLGPFVSGPGYAALASVQRMQTVIVE